MDDDFQIKGSTLTMKNTQDNGKHKISCRISGPLGSTTVSSVLYVVGKSRYFIKQVSYAVYTRETRKHLEKMWYYHVHILDQHYLMN